MKLDPRISAELARLEPNQIGVMAWSLMADPAYAGGLPGQPDPDSPEPTELANRPFRTSRHPAPMA